MSVSPGGRRGPRLTESLLVGEKAAERKLLCRPEFSADVPRATTSAPGRDRLPSRHKQPTKGRKEGGGRDGTSAQPAPRPPPGAPCSQGKRPLRGQRAHGGDNEGPSRSGGLSPGGAGGMLGTPRHACACAGAPTVAPCGAVPPAVGSHGHVLPPKYCFSCLGGLPQPLPPPPAGHHSAALLDPFPISTPSRVAPGFLRPRETVPASPVPPVPPPPL